MKRVIQKLWLTLLLLMVGVGSAWAEDATMTAGTNGSTAKVNDKDAIKVGTSNKGGDMTITVPTGATSLEFYAAAWNGVSGLSLNITPAANVSPTSVSLTADSGISGSGPFTLSGTESSYKFTIALSNITAETTLTLTSSIAKRFVVWGATYSSGSTPSDPYTVNFDAGSNGTCSTASLTEESAGAGVTLPNVTANTGYVFKGWATESDATTANAGAAGTTYKPSSDCTLYAVYGNLYTVTLGDNSATLTQTTEGGNVTLPTREGNSTYTFAGWSTTNNTVETTTAPTIIKAGDYKPTANITLYPMYKRVEGEEGYILSETVSGTTYYMKHDCSATTTKAEAEAFEWGDGYLTYVNDGNTYYLSHQASGKTNVVNNTIKPTEHLWTITENTTNKTVQFRSTAQTTRYLGYGSGFRAYAASHTLKYESAGATYYISSLPADKTPTSLSWSSSSATATIGKSNSFPTLTTDPVNLTGVIYSSSNTDVAAIDSNTGAITLIAAGETTITASYAGNETYAAATDATYILTCTLGLQSISVSGTPAEFWKGDAFNHDGITVTALWDDESETDVTSDCSFSTPDMSTAGTKTVTVTYDGQTTTYDIVVNTIANTQETAYTVAVAKALIDAGKDLATQVYVKGIISEIVTAWSDQYNNITYSISDDGSTTSQQFQLYRCVTNGAGVGDEVVGFGTLLKYGSTYEFSAGNSLVKVDKVATLSIADITVVNGKNIEPVITTNVTGEYAVEYVSDDEDVVLADGDELVTMGTGTATITATLTANGYKTVETTFHVTVTTQATVTSVTLSGELSKAEYTIGDTFDRSGLVATANYSDGTRVDVTETATWEVDPETLTTAGSVTVTVSASFGGQEVIQEYEVTVNKKTASISFEPATIEVEVNKTTAISAITTPDDAELNYTITEGSEFISIEDGNITGVAEGTATVRADFEGNDEYAAASASLTVNVIPEDPRVTATIRSFSETSGAIDECISYEAFKGGASTAPAIQNNCLRLYQNGGYVTISGKKGVKIQSVRLTTSATYASTTVGYCVDDENAPTVGESVSKSSSYTISGLNNQSVSIYCLGTDRDHRLEIAALEVKYIKEDIILNSIAVSGTYETEFIKNSVFNHDGAVVTATFSNGEEEDVTEFAEFTAPDMSTTGEKTVSISYTYKGVEKTTSYTIRVSEDIVTSIAVTGKYKKTFRTNEEFDHTGVVVTATYISGCEEDVTKDAEFSTPDLTTMGTKTVTVTYAEKTATYDIKVISANAVFYESFDTNVGTGGNDGQWSGTIALNDIQSDNDGWSFVTVSGAKQCAKLGAKDKKGSAQTPEISLSGDAKITFKAAAWNGNSEVTTLNLSATSGTLSQTTIEKMVKGEWTEYTVYLTGVEESTQITFEASVANNNRFFLDEVLVVEYQSTTEQIAISSVGYATYVTTEALDFNNCDGIQAYKVKVDTEKSNVCITQVYKVPANTAIVVKGAEAVYDIPTIIYADEDFSDNDLTFSEEKLTVNESFKYYVLANQNGACFAPVKDGAKIAARKGYFVVEGGSSDNASQFRITIEDGSETGIELREDVEDAPVIYNISGQRVESISKSGLFIVNGKKQLRN